MKPNQMRELMARNHLSNNDLATLTNKSARQIYSYLAGTSPIPRAESIMFLALDEGKIDLEWLFGKALEEMKLSIAEEKD